MLAFYVKECFNRISNPLEQQMATLLHSLLDADRLADCKREEKLAIERQALREKQRAQEAVRRLLRPRQLPGVSHELGYWTEVNRCEACIRDALRAYRFARGNSPIQTFGTAMRDHVRAKGYANA
jgi:hypothetical protein